jgi:uncharacterized protein YdeI (YjbR/CyaY-like superfamily)
MKLFRSKLPRLQRLSDRATSVFRVSSDLEIITFKSVDELWSWLAEHHETHPGVWVRLQKSRSRQPSVTFHELLEAGIAFGWSESMRRAYDSSSYVQRFTPRRTRGTTSERNLAMANKLQTEGKLTAAGRRALGW